MNRALIHWYNWYNCIREREEICYFVIVQKRPDRSYSLYGRIAIHFFLIHKIKHTDVCSSSSYSSIVCVHCRRYHFFAFLLSISTIALSIFFIHTKLFVAVTFIFGKMQIWPFQYDGSTRCTLHTQLES